MRTVKREGWSYYLRCVPRAIADAASRRASAEGRTVKWILVRALEDYGLGRYHPQPSAPVSKPK